MDDTWKKGLFLLACKYGGRLASILSMERSRWKRLYGMLTHRFAEDSRAGIPPMGASARQAVPLAASAQKNTPVASGAAGAIASAVITERTCSGRKSRGTCPDANASSVVSGSALFTSP